MLLNLLSKVSALALCGVTITVTAAGDPNAEGTKGSAIKLEDTDDGFNVTDSGGDFNILTSYLYNKCNKDQKKALKAAVTDANIIAYAGLKRLARPGAAPIDWLDFSHEAAIDYFGPSSRNGGEQNKIYTTISRASYAYRGWGWSDWWSGRYVQLNCDTTITTTCSKGTVNAFTSNYNKDFKYPLITFCDRYFNVLPTFDKALKDLDSANDKGKQQNLLNIKNQGSVMLHEWIHMNWGSAEICPGGAKDNMIQLGPDKAKAYRPGAAKMLAKQNIQAAANNNDNYVYYGLAWFMLRRYGKYPEYPTAWDPKKSLKENQAAQGREPGASNIATTDIDKDSDDDPDSDLGPEINDPLLDAKEYPDWYKPKVTASFSADGPRTLPEINAPPEPTEPPKGSPTVPLDAPKEPSEPKPEEPIATCTEDGKGGCNCTDPGSDPEETHPGRDEDNRCCLWNRPNGKEDQCFSLG